ncbi:MAG: MFS transporter [Bacilli bacterium]|jgi:MFS family permease|nr:MFS transporter [Bacilli bacterium]
MKEQSKKKNSKPIIRASMAFIVLMAVVSMFSDMVHEGANSIIGAFESFLGAPALVISIVGGAGTLIGCSLRFVTGYFADKTKHYWTFTIIGYAIDLVSVPLLACVPNGGWGLAVTFILMERVGKAIKKPAKDSIVSFAATQNGVGKSFAFGELLDQIGAFIGPMILTLTYMIRSDLPQYEKYTLGFLVLLIPCVICLIVLLLAFFKFRHPDRFEKDPSDGNARSFLKNSAFILFLFASAMLAIGFLDSFSLINSHLYLLGLVPGDYLPLLYSYAMFIDALSAVVFGLLYDKKGFLSIAIATFMTAGYSFFIFLIPKLWSIFVGLTMWGIGMGAEESVMKSGITTLSMKNERASAFGFYELVYGLFSFAGSGLIGWLYGVSMLSLCIVSSAFIIFSAILYLISDINNRKHANPKTISKSESSIAIGDSPKSRSDQNITTGLAKKKRKPFGIKFPFHKARYCLNPFTYLTI